MPTFPAHLVALPVLERLVGERSGVVLGAGATACWVDLDGFVVAVTTREVPLLPNAAALAAGSGSLQQAGAAGGGAARFTPGRIDLGTLRITWDPAAPPSWDPTIPEPITTGPEALAQRGASLVTALRGSGTTLPPPPGFGSHPSAEPGAELRAVDSPEPAAAGSATLPLRGPPYRRGGLKGARVRGPQCQQAGFAAPPAHAPRIAAAAGSDALVGELVAELARIGLPTATDPDGAAGLVRLLCAVRVRDPEPAGGAARELLGRGPGLTPEGDDLLAAVAGTLAVLGQAAGWDRSALDGFLAALVVPAPGRTTALSATLLELAARRRLIEPAGGLLDLGPGGEAAWPRALARLVRLGHGSGRAYAAGIAATTSLLAASRQVG